MEAETKIQTIVPKKMMESLEAMVEKVVMEGMITTLCVVLEIVIVIVLVMPIFSNPGVEEETCMDWGFEFRITRKESPSLVSGHTSALYSKLQRLHQDMEPLKR